MFSSRYSSETQKRCRHSGRDGPVFVPVPTETLNKCVQSVAPVDLWFLLEYDKLRINMRQKDDDTYKTILANLRVDTVSG